MKNDSHRCFCAVKIAAFFLIGVSVLAGGIVLLGKYAPTPNDPPPHFQITTTKMKSLGTQLYGDITTAVGNGDIQQNHKSVVQMSNKGGNFLVVSNPSGAPFSIPLGKLSKSTVVTGSTSTNGKRWCFQIVDRDTIFNTGLVVEAIVYTEKGMLTEMDYDTFTPEYKCYKGVTGEQPDRAVVPIWYN